MSDPDTRMLSEAVEQLMDESGEFEVEACPAVAGRLILTTKAGTRAEVDIRTVVWGDPR